ncbi:MAG: hypothetical protein GEU78_01795 [Actinobacteria bacterium]|nr:hypothetical protein [Actinomycetota bacterium]
MRLDGRIAVRFVLLLAWASFLAWLWFSGEMVRYLGPRTYWVIPFGALTLGGAALAHLPWLRGGPSEPVRRSDLVSGLIVVAPLLLVLAVPQPDLGSLAASRKASFGGGGGPALIVPGAGHDGEVAFIDLSYANESEEYALKAGVVEDEIVHLTGFVSEVSPDRVRLTRFYVSCCAADAVPYSADILLSPRMGGYSQDQWLRVRGRIAKDDDGRYVVEPTMIEPVAGPRDPYL